METNIKKSAKNGFFVSNFLFGKCVQNTRKDCFEINASCMRFETLCGDKFEKKRAKNGDLLKYFQFG